MLHFQTFRSKESVCDGQENKQENRTDTKGSDLLELHFVQVPTGMKAARGGLWEGKGLLQGNGQLLHLPAAVGFASCKSDRVESNQV